MNIFPQDGRFSGDKLVVSFHKSNIIGYLV